MSTPHTSLEVAPLLSNEREVAQMLNMALATVLRWWAIGHGPRWFKIGSAVRYPSCDVNSYVDAIIKATGAERIG